MAITSFRLALTAFVLTLTATASSPSALAAPEAPAPSEAPAPKERLVPLLPGDKTEVIARMAPGKRLTLSLWGERRHVLCSSCDTKAANHKSIRGETKALELIISKNLGVVEFELINEAALKKEPAVATITLKDGRSIALLVMAAPTIKDADERLVFVPF